MRASKDEGTPYISICIASFNYAGYLKRGFEAIKKQRFKDYEIIYLDDASRDESVSIIQKFISDNPLMNIRLKIHSKNEGLLKTKSELLELAQGEYVMLCDADDWMTDDCLAVLAQRARISQADRIISEVYDINEKGKILQIQNFAREPSRWLWNLHHGCLYKREIIKKNGLKTLLYPDDVYLSTIFNCYGQHVEWIEQPLYYWFVHKDSAGREARKSENAIFETFVQIADFIENIRKKLPDKREQEELGLLLIKLYYLQLFHEIKGCSVRSKLRLYPKLKGRMEEIYPDYYSNYFIKEKKHQPARKYAISVIRLGCFLERLHLMRPALVGYHIMNYWIEFDQ